MQEWIDYGPDMHSSVIASLIRDREKNGKHCETVRYRTGWDTKMFVHWALSRGETRCQDVKTIKGEREDFSLKNIYRKKIHRP